MRLGGNPEVLEQFSGAPSVTKRRTGLRPAHTGLPGAPRRGLHRPTIGKGSVSRLPGDEDTSDEAESAKQKVQPVVKTPDTFSALRRLRRAWEGQRNHRRFEIRLMPELSVLTPLSSARSPKFSNWLGSDCGPFRERRRVAGQLAA